MKFQASRLMANPSHLRRSSSAFLPCAVTDKMKIFCHNTLCGGPPDVKLLKSATDKLRPFSERSDSLILIRFDNNTKPKVRNDHNGEPLLTFLEAAKSFLIGDELRQRCASGRYPT